MNAAVANECVVYPASRSLRTRRWGRRRPRPEPRDLRVSRRRPHRRVRNDREPRFSGSRHQAERRRCNPPQTTREPDQLIDRKGLEILQSTTKKRNGYGFKLIKRSLNSNSGIIAEKNHRLERSKRETPHKRVNTGAKESDEHQSMLRDAV